ncbi:unnamed protein product, partial [Meganyctiphanes norvegica]
TCVSGGMLERSRGVGVCPLPPPVLGYSFPSKSTPVSGVEVLFGMLEFGRVGPRGCDMLLIEEEEEDVEEVVELVHVAGEGWCGGVGEVYCCPSVTEVEVSCASCGMFERGYADTDETRRWLPVTPTPAGGMASPLLPIFLPSWSLP